jgi:hypothetical protein
MDDFYSSDFAFVAAVAFVRAIWHSDNAPYSYPGGGRFEYRSDILILIDVLTSDTP